MISLDTETTGIDIYESGKDAQVCAARPFIVTVGHEDGSCTIWEWDVDPFTRAVIMPPEDIADVRALVDNETIVTQNGKFDAAVLREAGVVPVWPWARTEDTLLMSHILASNRPHDLTSLAIQYLGVDIGPLENTMKLAVGEARRLVQKHRRGKGLLADWRIAEEGLAGMPSAKGGSKKDAKGVESEAPWKFDCWLPRAVAGALCYPTPDDKCMHRWGGDWLCTRCGGHRWWLVTRDYANGDSAVTLPLGKTLLAEIVAKGYMPLYREKLRNQPVLCELERRGTSVLRTELNALRDEYREEIAAQHKVCLGIAAATTYQRCPECGHVRGSARREDRGNYVVMTRSDCDCEHRYETALYDLTLPKTGNNKSLTVFAFDVLKLPVIKTSDKTGAPSMDKEVIDEYKKTLDGPQLAFVKNLAGARKRAKSVEFLDKYEIFGVPSAGDVLVLHPSVNPTATATTRFSMSHPNLQQVSKEETQCEECLGDGCDACGGTGEDLHSVRRVFGPAPGRELWSADAANIELRIPAYESGEKALIDLFERPADPPFYGSQHMLNFSIVYDDLWRDEMRAVGYEKVGPHCKKKYGGTVYKWVKGGGLAMQYQCGPATANRAFRRDGYDKIKDFLALLKKHNDRQVRFAERCGFVETIPDRGLGMKRGYPLLVARTDFGQVLPTTPLNYRTQGTAGWWMVRAMNRCAAQLDAWRVADGFDGYIALTVHDELVFDLPSAPKTIRGLPGNLWRMRILKKLMEQGGEDIGVPTPVSLEQHEKSWARGISWA